MMNKLFFIGVLLVLFSCEKEIEYEGEGKAPRLVLDAILENDKVPFIRVSRSVFFLSNGPISDAFIADAEVKLTNLDSGAEYLFSSNGSGYYQGSDPVIPNTNYRIEVSHPDYETVSSEILTVGNVSLNGIDSSSVGLEYEKIYYVKYELNDPQSTNFYGVRLRAEKETTFLDENMVVMDIDTTWVAPYILSDDPSFEYRFGEEVFFNDLIFNGSTKWFSSQFNQYSLYSSGGFSGSWSEQDVQVIGYEATLFNFSEDTYKYFKSIENNQGADPFSDPVNVHTNVTNGLGIFGSVSSSIVEL